jgi:alanine racemase
MQPLPSQMPDRFTLRATHAVVHLDAIAHNVRLFRDLAPTSQVIAVVKGDAYGHGSIPVAGAALKAGAQSLAVYTVDEGLILRSAGITAPILIFGPIEACEAQELVSASLSPTISDLETLRLLEEAAGGGSMDVHIKVDTGLTRAGALPPDAITLARLVARHPRLRLASLYTHLARADEFKADSTHDQLGVLMATVDRIESQGIRLPLIHIRVGIGLYGYDPSRRRMDGPALRTALTLRSRLTRVTRVPEGTGVGYGHEFRAGTGNVVGLVPIGYGDGLPRQLGLGRGRVLVRGHTAPIVGRVSMDQITVDLTGIDGAAVGDQVVLIGESDGARQTADDLGDQAGTISYDIVTGLLPRIPRLYVEGGRPVGISRMGTFRPLPPAI